MQKLPKGTAAAILIGMGEPEALWETRFWLSQADNRETVVKAREELANGEGLTEEQIRAEFGILQRDS